MASALDAVEFFLEFCIRVFSRQENGNFLHFSQDVESTKFRIRRALFRFQLFAELFHQPGDDSSDENNVSDWEERLWAQELFWTQYTPLEVEECKCVYYVLIISFWSNIESKVLRPGLDDDSIQRRGLPQLRTSSKMTPLIRSSDELLLSIS